VPHGIDGNKKFPVPHTSHAQCPECVKEELETTKLMILFNNDAELVEKYQALQTKLK
jgi:hypothetical protein